MLCGAFFPLVKMQQSHLLSVITKFCLLFLIALICRRCFSSAGPAVRIGRALRKGGGAEEHAEETYC